MEELFSILEVRDYIEEAFSDILQTPLTPDQHIILAELKHRMLDGLVTYTVVDTA
jgi:hypothetical protein